MNCLETTLITRDHLEAPVASPISPFRTAVSVKRVALIGNHVPRRCGIATFTSDLANWLEENGCVVDVFAMSDRSGYDYPNRVRSEIAAQDRPAYRRVAQLIDEGNYDVVSLQHEYGIFGGKSGEYLLALLDELKTPVVTTLHTILDKPTDDQFRVMARIVERSKRLVVMSQRGKQILEQIHPLARGKVQVVPHGTPDASRCDRRAARAKLELKGRKTILTFGLLSRDKGIDQMILAMETVTKLVPDALFTIVGATHPHVLEHEGEAYRESLEALVVQLGLENNVRFVNEFVTLDALVEWLVSCDVYVCPYLKVEQITSGTLSYAYGLGKPVVSTPNWHAQELLASGGGSLVPPMDPEALAEAVLQQLAGLNDAREPDPHLQSMQWSNVAKTYLSTFEGVVETPKSRNGSQAPRSLPIGHLLALTDEVGIIQHGLYNLPRRAEGYCTDDNARALILALDAKGLVDEPVRAKLERTYLSFVSHAFNETRGTFHNFMGYDRQWIDTVGSEDCQSRALWSLAHVAAHSHVDGHRHYAIRWFGTHEKLFGALSSVRAVALALVALRELENATWSDQLQRWASNLSERLHSEFLMNATEGWPWWEPILAYDNARLPQGLFAAAHFLRDEGVKSDAMEALQWLCREQTGSDGTFAPIGSNGFYKQGETRAWFDQQPIEALATIQASLTAFEDTHDASWLFEARRAWDWFKGRNIAGLPMVTEDGGCYDGLMADSVNRNQGAESTLAYLSGWICMNGFRLSRREPGQSARYAI